MFLVLREFGGVGEDRARAQREEEPHGGESPQGQAQIKAGTGVTCARSDAGAAPEAWCGLEEQSPVMALTPVTSEESPIPAM